jgi:IclR family transcriptional regulator, KDG regulon repressor
LAFERNKKDIKSMAEQKLNALAKGLQVIQRFVFEKDAWGAREIARALGISKSSAFRILQTLQDQRFLNFTEKEQKYTIGTELWRIGLGLRSHLTLSAIAGALLRRYVLEVNETMFFFTHDQGKVIFETVVECSHDLRFHLKLGTPYDAQRGAAGKVLLAYLPPVETREIYRRLKKDPALDLDALKREGEQVKKEGYAFSVGERVKGVIGFAAPVLGPQEELLGGIGMGVPEARCRPDEYYKYADLVKACAQELSYAGKS